MSVQDQRTRLIEAREGCATAITDKGVSVPANAKLGDLPGYISQIESSAAPDDDTLDALEALESAVSDKLADTDEGIDVPRPYLHALGYLQCVAECTDDNTQPVELYEWLYQRLYIGDRVSTVTVDGKSYDTVVTYNDVDYLVIPLAQFAGITSKNYHDSSQEGNDTWYHIYNRVRFDNPELLGLTSFVVYQKAGEVTTGEDAEWPVGKIGIPLITNGEREEMLAACQASAAEVDAKVAELYGVAPGDELTVDQKKYVSKVIHDWIVLNNQYDTVNNGEEALDQTMYPALSGGVNSPVCASYALAYQWLALRYGIESVAQTGFVHTGGSTTADDGTVTYNGAWHMWNLVNIHERPGVWGEDAKQWTGVDCTWDDPVLVGSNGEYIDEPDYIQWDYFHFPWSALPQTPGTNGYRAIDHRAYKPYPAEEPGEDLRYTGSTPYTWEE
jgi:hypothetical protein